MACYVIITNVRFNVLHCKVPTILLHTNTSLIYNVNILLTQDSALNRYSLCAFYAILPNVRYATLNLTDSRMLFSLCMGSLSTNKSI